MRNQKVEMGLFAATVLTTTIFIEDRFYWRFKQLDCFNSNWRQKCPSLQKYFVCKPEIGPKYFDKLKHEPDPTYNAGCSWDVLLKHTVIQFPYPYFSKFISRREWKLEFWQSRKKQLYFKRTWTFQTTTLVVTPAKSPKLIFIKINPWFLLLFTVHKRFVGMCKHTFQIVSTQLLFAWFAALR